MATVFTVGTGETHSTITLAINAIVGDLTAAGEQHVQVFSSTGDYIELVDAKTGFTNASASDFIKIEAMVNHKLVRDAGIVIRLTTSPNPVEIISGTAFTQIIGFNITTNGQNLGSTEAIDINADGLIDRCMIYNFKDTTNAVLKAIQVRTRTIVRNCAMMDWECETGRIDLVNITGVDAKVENCIALNIKITNASLNFAFGRSSPFPAGVQVTNCYADFTGLTANRAFFALATGTVNNCISSDASADDFAGTGNLINKATANQFNNATQGSEDVTLKDGADCIDAAQTLGFTQDGKNATRIVPWDVGADDAAAVLVAARGFAFGGAGTEWF